MQSSKEEYQDIHEWHISAIEEGILAAEKGQVKDFEEVKQYWKKRFASLTLYRGIK